ncbi:DUF4124 domain-containing protein [Marinobacter persicus]|uniref:Uncharacterized protein DUF4124 n=1 Tax=Marinobacter persicus TaxID=930118 RepID=A0A2S6G814_9GAMM|nr:DUF4124 domain-containing protein [Marinobacter persicus]PPK52357.1 uncharacterized protein DUF4124 [Marinobacter persicus]PPK55333.1 uncharacterized protein DUF4124 [Marinobacter persicus]PPK59100.1 uncharacterized protein DUF4124 [Marinobacter persicus]
MELQPLDSIWIGVLISALLLSSPTTNAEIYQWTDSNGKVHFSDRVPVQHRDEANPVELSAKPPSKEEVEAAHARAERIRDAAESTAEANSPDRAPENHKEALPKPENAKTSERPPLTSPATPMERKKRYEQAMERYRKAQDCFGPYKNRNGSNRVEAYDKCPIIPRPRESDY